MGELSRDVLFKLGFEGCIGVQQIKLKIPQSDHSKVSKGRIARDSEKVHQIGR